MLLLLVFVGVLGASVGSFLNVVVHRVPLGLSVVTPASRCPECENPIRPRHNVPVVGWVVLRGRCADCRAGISPRYPLVELGTGLLFALVTWRAVQLGQLAAVPALLAFTALGIALSAIDLAERRLPDVLTLPAYPVLAVLLGGAAWLQGDGGAPIRAALGAVALFTAFLTLAVVSRGGMGMGDVKLSGLVGLLLGYLSWSTLVVGAFAGFFLGAAVGVVVLAVGGGGRRTAVPFGPFMVAGALLALWVTGPVVALLLPA